jgi:Cu(I)/Ag(I) efflux system membrane protein CusA/SilA
MLIYLNQALEKIKARRVAEGSDLTRVDLYEAIMEGAVERVRPKMMTVVAIVAGLLPIMWSRGTGSEIMQRIAVPMIGGMISYDAADADRHPGDLWPGQRIPIAAR